MNLEIRETENLIDLLPYERQLIMAEIYHYCWYNTEAFNEIKTFINKYAEIEGKPILYTIKENNESTNAGA